MIPPLPSRGGPAWLEVKSEHFTLWTDASAARGYELVQQMEHHRQVIMRAMNNAPSKARSFAIALRDDREVDAYLPKGFIAFAWTATGAIPPGLLFAANTPDRDHALTHELTHVISHSIVAHPPHWLGEGIATYFEMAELDPGATSVKVGIPRSDRLEFFRSSRPVPTAELFACKDHPCMDDAFYATSWALFSFLVNEHFDQLARYMQRLNELTPDDDDAAVWHDVFPELTPAILDRELSRFVLTGELKLPRIQVAVQDFPAAARPLADSDVLAARSLLHRGFAPDATAARADLAAALAADRTNVLARVVEATLNHSISPDDARAVAAAHPDDWRAWWLVVAAVESGSEANEAYAKMCSLAGDDVPQCARPH